MTKYIIDPQLTSIQLIKENLNLARRLISNSHKKILPFDPNNTQPFYKGRAKHLQTMAILGITMEYLLKLIVSKRGYSIFEVDYIKNADKNSEIKYVNKTISYEKSALLFKKSNPADYYKNTKVYEFNTHDIDYQYSYLGYKRIKPETCVTLIQKIRNNYLHKVDSHGEWNGIIWYVYNFIVWLAKKEFKNNFKRFRFIGSADIKNLFQ